ncbi:unnamed protein product, partial [Acidithrix sp. C25]
VAQPYGSRYEIVDKIARGGMADVFRARDLLLDRLVALKVLFPELSTSSAFVERFRREATAAANLSHPNIVSVFDWGRSENSYFIVMELIEGETLGSLIRKSGTLSFDYAAAIAADVASALSYAHRHGVVHRDIKPGNVLITSDGHIKVTDFGIARAQSANEDLTQTGSVMGTATYISPEQAEGKVLDGRSDVYSLGVVLFEMVIGKPPFSGDSTVSVAMKQVNEPTPSVSRLRSETPAALVAIIDKALAKVPNDRYETAQDFRADLLRFIQGRPVDAARDRVMPDYGDTTTVMSEVSGYSQTTMMASNEAERTTIIPVIPAPPKRRRENTGTVVAILAAIIVLGLFFFLFRLVQGHKSNNPSTTNTTLASVSVPSVVGDTLSSATTSLGASHLRFKINYQQSSSVPSGTVLSQSPVAGSSVSSGTSVSIQVSSGAALVTLPNVTNQTIGNAESQLVPLGFSITTTYVNSSSPNGTVIKQNPTGASKVPAGSTVTLTVSNGPSTISVPDVTGKPSAQAANALGTAGLSLGNTTNQSSNSVPNGDVISTNPPAGTAVAPNSSVDIVVSTGPGSPATTTSTTTTAATTTTTAAPATTTTTTAAPATTTTTTAAG